MSSSPLPRPDLQGRVAVVTGASRGIGRAMVLALAESGCAVTVAAKAERSASERPGSIHEVAAEVEARGGRALPVRVDVRQEADIEAMLARRPAARGGEHGIGVCALWPAAAPLEILCRPVDVWQGRAVTDEEVLRDAGLEDFSGYACVPGDQPLYITGEAARGLDRRERTGGRD